MNIDFFFIFLISADIFTEAVVHQPNRLVCPGISLKNGKVKRRQKGRFVKFFCNTGFLLAGERHSTCVRGKWDPPSPKCVRATCLNKVLPPVNGLIYPSHNGAALHFFCRAGFTLRGPADVVCDGKVWDNNAPLCMEGYGVIKEFDKRTIKCLQRKGGYVGVD